MVQFVGPAYFSRTTNFGASWSPPKIVFDPGDNAQTINNRVVVTPNGAVIDFFTHIFTDGTLTIDLVRSADSGATFGPRINAQTINSSSGAVFGTPTVAGTFNFTVTVNDSSVPQKTASRTLTITVSGVTTPALALLPFGYDQRQAIRDLAPS